MLLYGQLSVVRGAPLKQTSLRRVTLLVHGCEETRPWVEGGFVQGMGWMALEELKFGDKKNHKWIRPGSLFTAVGFSS